MNAILNNRVLYLGVIYGAFNLAVADDPAKSGKAAESLIAVTTSEKKTVVGESVEPKQGTKNLFIHDVVTGKDVEIPEKQIVGQPQTVTDEEAIKLSGNPGAVIAWRISQKIVQAIPKGKVASISGGTIYTTMGAKDRLSSGSELLVYRGEELIKDPDSGEVIGRQRRLIAKLDVVSVEEKSSKAKLKGEFETTLNVGDQVELPTEEPTVAVLPATDTEGNALEGSVKIANEIVSQLVRRKVKVVERKKFTDALAELAIQQTELFDAATAAKLGKFAGASYVVTGNVTRPAKSGFKAELSLRLVSVETGNIVSATNFESYPFRFESANKKFVVALGERSKPNWLLNDIQKDARIFSDRDYKFILLPKELNGAKYLARDSRTANFWLPDESVKVTTGGTVYALVQWKQRGKVVVDEGAFAQLERDGWKVMKDEITTTFPNAEDWQWKALKRDLPEGNVVLRLTTLNWGQRLVIFAFR